jgi:hypothetical protein
LKASHGNSCSNGKDRKHLDRGASPPRYSFTANNVQRAFGHRRSMLMAITTVLAALVARD